MKALQHLDNSRAAGLLKPENSSGNAERAVWEHFLQRCVARVDTNKAWTHPPRVRGSGAAAVALTVPLGHSGWSRPIPLGTVLNSDIQSVAPHRRGDGTALPAGDEHPGKTRRLLLPHILGPDYPPFWAAGGPRWSCGVQLRVRRRRKAINKLQADMSITKYLMYLFSKVGRCCAHCAQMLSDNGSCKRSTQATQQNAAENYSSTSQEKLKPKLNIIYSEPDCKTFISFQKECYAASWKQDCPRNLALQETACSSQNLCVKVLLSEASKEQWWIP